MGTSSGAVMNSPGGGASAIFGPDGRQLSQDIEQTQEGIIYADLDTSEILKAKSFLDPVGRESMQMTVMSWRQMLIQ
jgi:nitrilase